MNDSTREMIRLALDNDSSMSPVEKRAALKACLENGGNRRPRLGTAKQAAAILSCHPKTVYRYARRGMLQPIHYSARKVRFDLDEVEAFAARGIFPEDASDQV